MGVDFNELVADLERALKEARPVRRIYAAARRDLDAAQQRISLARARVDEALDSLHIDDRAAVARARGAEEAQG